MNMMIWWLVRSIVLLSAIAYLFLHMEWLEDRIFPFADPSGPEATPRYIDYIDERVFRG